MEALPVRIVVADDSLVYRRTICSILRKTTGLQVVAEAEHGLAAIQAVEDYRPDVVLMDVSMPVLDGIEATRIIKSKFPGTRVIVLTMNADKSCSDQAYQVGACGFLSKECGKNELFRAIKDCSPGK
jgi:two-component system, NarL family, nitrate/nitrite response regulator NarL